MTWADFLLALKDPNLLLDAGSLLADKARFAAGNALRRVVKLLWLSLLCLGVALCLAILLAISLSTDFSPPWLNLVLITLCGVASLAGMAVPVLIAVIAVEPALNMLPGFKARLGQFARSVGSAAFLVLFAVFSYWRLQNAFTPTAAASLFFIMLVIGLGSATGWVLLPRASIKAVITSQLSLCFLFVLASALLPKLLPAACRWARHREQQEASKLDDVVSEPVKIDPDKPPKWFGPDGTPIFRFARDHSGTIRVFYSDVKYDPFTREKTAPLKSADICAELVQQARDARNTAQRAAAGQRDAEERARLTEANRRQREAADRERQMAAEGERRYRDRYISESILSAARQPGTVLVVIRTSGTDAAGAAIASLLSDCLLRARRMPVRDAIKPEFAADGLFDAAWGGDTSSLTRLRLFDGAPRCLLLAKLDFSSSQKTTFDGLVSVSCTLAVNVIDKNGRKRPSAFSSVGAGVDERAARANCLKRVAETLDGEAMFRE
jgi:hypothetical protein